MSKTYEEVKRATGNPPRKPLKMADMSKSVFFEWGTECGKRYRVTDRNGLPTVEEWIGSDWCAIRLPFECDPVLLGFCQLAKRLSRAEAMIEHFHKGRIRDDG